MQVRGVLRYLLRRHQRVKIEDKFIQSPVMIQITLVGRYSYKDLMSQNNINTTYNLKPERGYPA